MITGHSCLRIGSLSCSDTILPSLSSLSRLIEHTGPNGSKRGSKGGSREQHLRRGKNSVMCPENSSVPQTVINVIIVTSAKTPLFYRLIVSECQKVSILTTVSDSSLGCQRVNPPLSAASWLLHHRAEPSMTSVVNQRYTQGGVRWYTRGGDTPTTLPRVAYTFPGTFLPDQHLRVKCQRCRLSQSDVLASLAEEPGDNID